MNAADVVAAALASALDGRAAQAYGLWCIDVPAVGWLRAVSTARDEHGLTYLDWLSGVDVGQDGFSIVAHVLDPDTMTHLLLRTQVPREKPRLASVRTIHRGAGWHERETAEMYGVSFDGHPDPLPLLLPDGFEGHPLRKDFVLAARVVKAWPGAKEPGESDASAAPRRRIRPPGVPEPGEWGREETGE
ncbi:MAG: NADH-quinone oxidoreductase subunit C [Geodermatophilaceae bacterium]|nr:NADH-quinone oxidoreductase subunit C [Geodermatophilaceae bacterium]